jgi:hypothetical protein
MCGAIVGDVVDRKYRLIGGPLNPKLGSALHGSGPPPAAHHNVLTGHMHDNARLQRRLRRASDPGLTLLEAGAIGTLSQRGLGGGPATATDGARSGSERPQSGAAELAAWDT